MPRSNRSKQATASQPVPTNQQTNHSKPQTVVNKPQAIVAPAASNSSTPQHQTIAIHAHSAWHQGARPRTPSRKCRRLPTPTSLAPEGPVPRAPLQAVAEIPLSIRPAFPSDPHLHQTCTFPTSTRHQISIPIRSALKSESPAHEIRVPIRSAQASEPQPHPIHFRNRSTSAPDPHTHEIHIAIRSAPTSDSLLFQIRIPPRSACTSDPHHPRSAPTSDPSLLSDPNTHQIRQPIRSTLPQTSRPCARQPVSTGDRRGLGCRRSASSRRRQGDSRRRGATGRAGFAPRCAGAGGARLV